MLHHRGLVIDHQDLSLADDPDPVSHQFGFLDIMRGKNDRRAAFPQGTDLLPHTLAQLDIDASGGFIEKKKVGFVRQRLCNQHPALHAARKLADLRVLLLPQAEAAQDFLNARLVGRQTKQPARI